MKTELDLIIDTMNDVANTSDTIRTQVALAELNAVLEDAKETGLTNARVAHIDALFMTAMAANMARKLPRQHKLDLPPINMARRQAE